MILIDSSTWIDFLKGKETAQTLYLRNQLSNKAVVCTCPTIIQELLQGVKNEKESQLIEHYYSFLRKLYLEPYKLARDAAFLYRSLRKKGVTIRKPNDCLIAIYALEFNLEIVHNDIDFDLIAQNSSLKIYKP